MSKVYVTQENTRLNYMDAERYGEVVFLTATEYSSNPNSKRNAIVRSEIQYGLITFNNEKDYLLLCGDPIVMVLAFNQVANLRAKRFKVRLLKWDGQNRRYDAVEVWVN